MSKGRETSKTEREKKKMKKMYRITYTVNNYGEKVTKTIDNIKSYATIIDKLPELASDSANENIQVYEKRITRKLFFIKRIEYILLTI